MPRHMTAIDVCTLVTIELTDTLFRVAEKALNRSLWADRILSKAAQRSPARSEKCSSKVMNTILGLTRSRLRSGVR